MNNVQGVREMLAGQLLISAVVGLATVMGMVALSAPLLVTLIAYPVVSSLTLLLTAALTYRRCDEAPQGETFLRAEA